MVAAGDDLDGKVAASDPRDAGGVRPGRDHHRDPGVEGPRVDLVGEVEHGPVVNWDAIGALAELLGAAGVVASLLYLATQMRQSNRLAKRAAAQALLSSRNEFNRFLASSAELNELCHKGLEAPDELSETEWNRFQAVTSSLIRTFEAVFLDHREGLLPSEVWQSQSHSMRRWMSTPGAQKILRQFQGDFDAGFVRYVSSDGDGDAA